MVHASTRQQATKKLKRILEMACKQFAGTYIIDFAILETPLSLILEPINTVAYLAEPFSSASSAELIAKRRRNF